MTRERYARAAEVFLGACKRSGPERDAVLQRECGNDTALLAEVRSLLEHHQQGDDLFGRADAPPRIGGYTIVGVLGEGGMGVVYRAEQESPRRTVALKVIRPGIGSAGARKRFAHEAQLLGRLQHPGIAQIFEAGSVPCPGQEGASLPFFAMELVEGQTLLDYCDSNSLGVRERLALMKEVCDAVEHAHQRGVIHRDLKPGNIIVQPPTRSDPGSLARPKVLDFGVARAIGTDAPATTALTQVGQIMGTLAYMSPEQVSGDPEDPDSRCDIYSLGVVLYELLAGRPPHDLSSKTIPEAVRIISSETPAPLGTVSRVCRGDLATIVGKAMEKDRARRYQSAAELGADIGRHLRDEPITARPASALYEMSKFAKRNKPLVGGAAAALLALAGGAVATAHQAVQARRGWAIAQREGAKADRITQFLQKMLGAIDPDIAQGRDVTLLREMLDRASRDAEAELSAAPEVQSEVRFTIGGMYLNLGLYSEAEPHLRAVVEFRRGSFGDHDARTAAAVNKLGSLFTSCSRYDDAEPLLRESLATMQRALGAETAEAAHAENDLAELLLGRYPVTPRPEHLDEAESLLRQALATRRTILGDGDAEVARTMKNLGLAMQFRRNAPAAEEHYRGALDILIRARGEESRPVATLLFQIASLREHQRDAQEAERLYRRSLDIYQKLLGPHHSAVATVQRALGRVLLARGDAEAAEPFLRAAVESQRRIHDGPHLDTADALSTLVSALLDQIKLEEAEAVAREAASMYEQSLPAGHPWTAMSRAGLARVLRAQGSYDEAEAILREVVPRFRAQAPDADDLTVAAGVNDLASVLRLKGDASGAEPLYREALEIRRRTLLKNDYAIADSLIGLGRVRLALGDGAEAAALIGEGAAIAESALPENDWRRQEARSVLGECFLHEGKYADAEPLLTESHAALVASHADPRRLREARLRLIDLYLKTGRTDDASRYSAMSP